MPGATKRRSTLLHEESGTAFDPRCVAALEQVLEAEGHSPAAVGRRFRLRADPRRLAPARARSCAAPEARRAGRRRPRRRSPAPPGGRSRARPAARCASRRRAAGRGARGRRCRSTTTFVVPVRRSRRPVASTNGSARTARRWRWYTGGGDDQVDRPQLVLEQHERHALRGRGALAGDHQARDGHPAARAAARSRPRLDSTASGRSGRSSAIGCSAMLIRNEP